jgi:hypothetical protein
MARKTSKSLNASQILFKEQWRYFNGGGRWLEYVEDVRGDNLLEKVPLEEIVPGEQYYMQQKAKPNHFHPTVFDPIVNWSTIEELQPRVWRRK